MTIHFEIDTDALQANIIIPYFEDATGDTAPNYSSKRSIDSAKSELSLWISKHGGLVTALTPIRFTDPKLRYGFMVNFILPGGAQGCIHIAGLPMRKETPEKKNRVLTQALLNLAEEFRAAYLARLHKPYSNPLFEYLLIGGEYTYGQMIIEKQQFALLPAGKDTP